MKKIIELAILSVDLVPEGEKFVVKDLIPNIIWDKIPHGDKVKISGDFYKIYEVLKFHGIERLGEPKDGKPRYQKKISSS